MYLFMLPFLYCMHTGVICHLNDDEMKALKCQAEFLSLIFFEKVYQNGSLLSRTIFSLPFTPKLNSLKLKNFALTILHHSLDQTW